MRRLPPVTLNLLIINTLFFVATMVIPNINQFVGLHYFDSPEFMPYQIITSMFAHWGFGHFFFNMFALYMFGTVIEGRMGPKDFLKFYLLCGLGATLIHTGVQIFELHNVAGQITGLIHESNGDFFHSLNTLSASEKHTIEKVYFTNAAGASGCLYGVLVAFGMFYPNEKLMLIFLPVPIKAKIFIPIMILFALYSGISDASGDNTAHFAHLGGALFGFLLIKFWFSKR